MDVIFHFPSSLNIHREGEADPGAGDPRRFQGSIFCYLSSDEDNIHGQKAFNFDPLANNVILDKRRKMLLSFTINTN